MPEFPTADNDDISNPNYTSFYKKNRPGVFSKFLFNHRITKKPLWTESDFYTLLSKITNKNAGSGLLGSNALVLKAIPNSQFIILGNIDGSFHSLVKILDELFKKQIFDNDFKIDSPLINIVFNGNIIDGSPYTLEIIEVILRLLGANPNRVFYIRGSNEDKDYWSTRSLQREIELRLSNPRQAKSIFHDFFYSLPLTIYTIFSENKTQLKISYFDLDSLGFNNANCVQKLLSGNSSIFPCFLDKAQQESQINACVMSESKYLDKSFDGLKFVADQKVPSWAIISAASRFHRQTDRYFFDSFSILTFGNSLEKSIISYFKENIHEPKGFEFGGVFELLTGKKIENLPIINFSYRTLDLLQESVSGHKVSEAKKEVEVPTEKKEVVEEKKEPEIITPVKEETVLQPLKPGVEPIIVGCTLDLSKGGSIQGKNAKAGINLFVNKINNEGGIKGRPLQVIIMNDEYNPSLTRKSTENFIKEYKSTLILSSLGSPTLEAILDLIKEKKYLCFSHLRELHF